MRSRSRESQKGFPSGGNDTGCSLSEGVWFRLCRIGSLCVAIERQEDSKVYGWRCDAGRG